MFELFTEYKTCQIVLTEFAKECVRLAAQDLRENLLKLSGKQEGFEIGTAMSEKSIVIQTTPLEAPAYPEGYVVKVDEDGVTIKGSDALGTVYGIYAFATKILGIDPMYRFTDIFPEERKSMTIEETCIISKDKPTRFRGWFINDEDFLSGFAPSGHKRRITYNQEFFKEVISVEMMNVIYETVLRLEMNLIIPGSYIDILNPAEEAIVEAATKRGLYVSQHHQEPVGVAYFAAENYMQEHYPDKAVSYVASPREMEEVWRTYIRKWAKYAPYVIWQLGLRGKGDKAVWQTDGSVGDNAKKRGEIISSAIALQYRIISETIGHSDFLSTSTLWLEGAKLYDEGHLEMPKETMVVFSDIGDTQLFGADFYGTTRHDDCKYGIYYHAGFYVEGPHYVDGTDPNKMVFCYQEAEKYHSLEFSILNVANIRELCASIRLNAAILEGKPSEFNLEEYYAEIYPKLFGEASEIVIKLEKEYFAAIGDLGNDIAKQIIDRTDFHYYEYDNLPFPYYPLTDGAMARIGSSLIGYWLHPFGTAEVYLKNEANYHILQNVLQESERKFEQLLMHTMEYENMIPRQAYSYYRYSQIYRAYVMLHLTRWALCTSKMGKGHDVEKNRECAIQNLENSLAFRKEFEQGKWAGWYACDRRIDLSKRIEQYTKEYQYGI